MSKKKLTQKVKLEKILHAKLKRSENNTHKINCKKIKSKNFLSNLRELNLIGHH